MVLLNFTLFVRAPLPTVFAYFSRFEKIAEWDPNVKESKLTKETKTMLGSQYDLVTVWKGKESDITYEMIEYE